MTQKQKRKLHCHSWFERNRTGPVCLPPLAQVCQTSICFRIHSAVCHLEDLAQALMAAVWTTTLLCSLWKWGQNRKIQSGNHSMPLNATIATPSNCFSPMMFHVCWCYPIYPDTDLLIRFEGTICMWHPTQYTSVYTVYAHFGRACLLLTIWTASVISSFLGWYGFRYWIKR